jgi:hypothetical protein
LTKPFHPVLKALLIVGFDDTSVFVVGAALTFSCTRRVASETRPARARFVA